MALETHCQTPGANYHVYVDSDFGKIIANVDLPPDVTLTLSVRDAELLERNIHNALELVLAPFFPR